ncbi:MAG: putative transcriptional regulator, ArsR family protein [Chloroflexota bacterium]|nr:ArsR family transcriptional regulator [Anaerolineae bacterium CFX4]GIK30085.1 MAG: putative transcriptional regulator, ArsR family protein [Chloroflexota bacterium]
MDTEQVFKALADANRRTLLDRLFQRDGQTLGELQSALPDMTRFGVMKHLQVLETAGLITTHKVGREKFHYLNTVPIQQVYDRWVSKFSQPWARSLVDLKTVLEETPMTEKPNHVYEVFIKTTPEQLWNALTQGDITRLYYFGTRVKSDWKPGSAYAYHYDSPEAQVMLEGEVLEADPPRKLVTTFRPVWNDSPEGQRTSRVTFEIEQLGPACRLVLTHSGLNPDAPLTMGIGSGWAQILSGLKTLLETGDPLVIATPQAEEA